MTALSMIKRELSNIGYSAVITDYRFSDVFSSATIDRTVPIAAFTQTPPSYRNAALGVVEAGTEPIGELIARHRALGAPLFLVVETNQVSVWKVGQNNKPLQLIVADIGQLPNLFATHREQWNPRAIHLAKSLGQFNRQYQLSFVDLGLLPAIEGETHTKLDELLQQALTDAVEGPAHKLRIDEHMLFRAVFRFLAAKILRDRSHKLVNSWNDGRVETVLNAISEFYGLDSFALKAGTKDHAVLTAVWNRIKNGINFQNISSEDLAFVYENTLVTPEIRKRLGTHSTPRQIAEYVVQRLGISDHDPKSLRVYEPFAGSAVFLVSALRHLREQLPSDWTDAQRHDFLVKRISGDEIDPFACEVATLSLILADYPNRNGWKVRHADLFAGDMLIKQMRSSNVILCNPPFEKFSLSDRKKYDIAKSSPFQPIAVLNAALDAAPVALGFVLPRPFILEKQYSAQRRRIEAMYGEVELVELPDRTFNVSKTETALLIARSPRTSTHRPIKLRSTEVLDRQRTQFLKTGETSLTRETTREFGGRAEGNLWIPPLQEVWEYLGSNATLADELEAHRGIEWNYEQGLAFQQTEAPGYRKGLHSARHSQQYVLKQSVWLDCTAESLRGGAINLPWDKPKLICNAIRLRRGPWRLAAAYDESGLVCSQQFVGLWPKGNATKADFMRWAAILNGPVANAFMAINSPQKGIRIGALEGIPTPFSQNDRLSSLVTEYVKQIENPELFSDQDDHLLALLYQIDSAVLEAYDLPPKLERKLLEYFRASARPVRHSWRDWFPENFKPFIPLHEYVSDEYQKLTRPWVQEVFRPLPPEEADAILRYMD